MATQAKKNDYPPSNDKTLEAVTNILLSPAWEPLVPPIECIIRHQKHASSLCFCLSIENLLAKQGALYQLSKQNRIACQIYAAATLLNNRFSLFAACTAVKSDIRSVFISLIDLVKDERKMAQISEIEKRLSTSIRSSDLISTRPNIIGDTRSKPRPCIDQRGATADGNSTPQEKQRPKSPNELTIAETAYPKRSITDVEILPYADLNQLALSCETSTDCESHIYKYILGGKDVLSEATLERIRSFASENKSPDLLITSVNWIEGPSGETLYLNDVASEVDYEAECLKVVHGWHQVEGKFFNCRVLEKHAPITNGESKTGKLLFLLRYISSCNTIEVVAEAAVHTCTREPVGLQGLNEEEAIGILNASTEILERLIRETTHTSNSIERIRRQALIHTSILMMIERDHDLTRHEMWTHWTGVLVKHDKIKDIVRILAQGHLSDLYRFTIRLFCNQASTSPFAGIDRLIGSPKQTVKASTRQLYDFGFCSEALNDLRLITLSSSSTRAREEAAYNVIRWKLENENNPDWDEMDDLIEECRNITRNSSTLSKLLVAELLSNWRRGKSVTAAQITIKAETCKEWNPDAWLAASNFCDDENEKISIINKALTFYSIPEIDLLPSKGVDSLYDRLCTKTQLDSNQQGPLVSVLVATYNSGRRLSTCLRSLAIQTWRNIEVLIVDDCSTDNETIIIAEEYCKMDKRFRLFRLDVNGGAYVARNYALEHANGEFITLHDSDDWSHPLKIETQVRELVSKPHLIGCTSEQARCTSSLQFCKLRYTGGFIMFNTSSFMWRRVPVVNELGCWDSVRIGADSEFIERIRFCFGQDSVTKIITGPLSFQRDSDTSITSSGPKSLASLDFGVRREYKEMQHFWANKGGSLKLKNSPYSRPFPVPDFIKPIYNKETTKEYETVVYADIYEGSEDIECILNMLSAFKEKNINTGVAGIASYSSLRSKTDVDHRVREMLDGWRITRIVYGEKFTSRKIICISGHFSRQRYIPLPESLLLIKN